MASCLEIPGRFKNDRHPWYLDERVSCQLEGLLVQPASKRKVALLPTGEKRWVYAYDNLWLDDHGRICEVGAPEPP